MDDKDFRIGDKVYDILLKKIGEVTLIQNNDVFVKFENSINIYLLDGSYVYSDEIGQALYHDPDRKIMSLINNHLKNICKPPKRLT